LVALLPRSTYDNSQLFAINRKRYLHKSLWFQRDASGSHFPRTSKRTDVFKIQRSGNGVTVIALIGRMEKEHIVELETLLEAEPPDRRVVLDLKHLTFAGP